MSKLPRRDLYIRYNCVVMWTITYMKPILFVHGYRALCDLMPFNLPPSPTTPSQTLELSHYLFKKTKKTLLYSWRMQNNHPWNTSEKQGWKSQLLLLLLLAYNNYEPNIFSVYDKFQHLVLTFISKSSLVYVTFRKVKLK